MFHDEKPTNVRQSLNAIKEVIVFKLELCDSIRNEVMKIDLAVYKDSMVLLIKKDINSVLETLDEVEKNKE